MKNVCETVSNRNGQLPERVLQFGEGNFLRAFADWMIDLANDEGDYAGSIVLCQPIEGGEEIAARIKEQQGVYTLAMRGMDGARPVEKYKKITSVSRCINVYRDYEAWIRLAKSEELSVVISNTTEAGITYRQGDQLEQTPPSSFPAKVCQFLYKRYQAFQGAHDKGLLFLPVELIDHNGDELKRIVLRYAAEWGLPQTFQAWILEANKFTNTLVDRIVTGYPKDEIDYFKQQLSYEDKLLVTSEWFHLWVIEGKPEWAELFPIHRSGVNVLWTEDAAPYKMRKVRILNGSHTAMVLAAYLCGYEIVLDFMKDAVFLKFFDQLIYGEVIQTVPLEETELREFAEAVKERFLNPYSRHRLLDISLNSCAKFKARCLPSLLAYYERKGELPKLLVFSLAALIYFYKGKMQGDRYQGIRADGAAYPIQDEPDNLKFFAQLWENYEIEELAAAVLKKEELWGQDLTKISGLSSSLSRHLRNMHSKQMKKYIKELICER